MSGPCLCGAPDCPRCFPGSWWHNPDTCDGSDHCGCEEPYEDEIDESFWDEPYDDRAELRYEAHIQDRRG